MTVPLLRRPGTLVFVDEDREFLEMLATIVPAGWQSCFFARADSALEHFQARAPFVEEDAWALHEPLRQWMETGAPLAPQVLRYWCTHTERFGLASVLSVDPAMPRMTGAELLQKLHPLAVRRLVITKLCGCGPGPASSCGCGPVDCCLRKDSRSLAQDLVAVLQGLRDCNPRQERAWSSALSPRQQALLDRPGVAPPLEQLLHEAFEEYVVLGEPYGALGLSPSGCLGWIQFVDGTMDGLPKTACNLELLEQLGAAALATEEPVQRTDPYGALGVATFDLGQVVPSPIPNYGEWRKRQPQRAVPSA